jgi:hypothetical protein
MRSGLHHRQQHSACLTAIHKNHVDAFCTSIHHRHHGTRAPTNSTTTAATTTTTAATTTITRFHNQENQTIEGAAHPHSEIKLVCLGLGSECAHGRLWEVPGDAPNTIQPNSTNATQSNTTIQQHNTIQYHRPTTQRHLSQPHPTTHTTPPLVNTNA